MTYDFQPPGPTPFGSFQKQVADTVKDEARRDYTYVSRVLGFGPCKTEDDIAELVGYYIHYVPEALYFEDKDHNEIEINGIQSIMMYKSQINEYFGNTLVFEYVRSKTKKSIQDRWYEETRPRNLEAQNFERLVEILRDGVDREWDRDHPEEAPGTLTEVGTLRSEVVILREQIAELENKLKGETGAIAGKEPDEGKTGPLAPRLLPSGHIKLKTERFWKVWEQLGKVEVYEDAKEPENIANPVSLRIEFGTESSVFSEIFYNVRYASIDGFHIFTSRIKQLVTMFLDTGEEEGTSDVETDIPYYPSLNVPNPMFMPVTHNGQIEKKRSAYRVKRSDEYDLRIISGKHILKWTVVIERSDVDAFMQKVCDLVEMILLSGEGEKEKTDATVA